MHKKMSVMLAVTLLLGSALAQSHPEKFGWKATTTENFTLSNRATRKFPVVVRARGGDRTTLVEIKIESKYPVNVVLEDSRGDAHCRYAEVSGLTATCSLQRDSTAKFIVIEDANQAGVFEGAKGSDALNRVSLVLSNYTCLKNCPIQ